MELSRVWYMWLLWNSDTKKKLRRNSTENLCTCFFRLSSGNRKQMFFFLNRAGSGVLPSSSVYSHVYSFTLRPSLFFLWSECNFSLVFSLCRPFPHSHFCLMLAGWWAMHIRVALGTGTRTENIIPTKNPTWKTGDEIVQSPSEWSDVSGSPHAFYWFHPNSQFLKSSGRDCLFSTSSCLQHVTKLVFFLFFH